MSGFDLVIGLEVHVQLKTQSKMFCSCSADYFAAEPNTHVCPVCLGLPGALPVANREAIRKALLTGLALNCTIPSLAKFDRKNYFYPDLVKGFQISQYDQPFATDGYIMVGAKKIRINRAHQEEDTGKLIHGEVDGKPVSLVDYNRSGVPLLEIVSEPDLSTPEEAKEYAQKLNLILRTIEVADVDMEKAGMRFDANLSLKPQGEKELGTKVEIKNINSFRFLEKAIYYEYSRQAEILKEGGKIVQETRGWVESKGITQSQRVKEQAHDYRYFPEPDLTIFNNNPEYISSLKEELKKLPDELVTELVNNHGLEKSVAQVLVEKEGAYGWYQQALTAYQQTEKAGINVDHIDQDKAQKIASWITKDVIKGLSDAKISFHEVSTLPAQLAELLYLVDKGELAVANARAVLIEIIASGDSIANVIAKHNFAPPSAVDLDSVTTKIIESNSKAVSDYLSGKEQAVFFLVGQVVRETRGAANPDQAREVILEKLNAHRT